MRVLKKSSDYKKDKSGLDLSPDEISKIDWTKYKIIVPTEKDRRELMEAFEHIHYSNIDTNYVTVNQLAHEYLDDDVMDGAYNNIIVDSDIFRKIENRKG